MKESRDQGSKIGIECTTELWVELKVGVSEEIVVLRKGACCDKDRRLVGRELQRRGVKLRKK